MAPAFQSRLCSTIWRPATRLPSSWPIFQTSHGTMRSRFLRWRVGAQLRRHRKPPNSDRSQAMRVLLDNCIPRRLATLLDGVNVTAAVDIGWAGLTNRDLLDAMVGHY